MAAMAQVQLESDPFASAFFARKITGGELRQHVEKLSSPDFAGRETGTPGQELAAQYIIDRLQASGVERIPELGRYYQDVIFTNVRWENLSVELNDSSYRHLRDFVCYQRQNNNMPNWQTDEVVFLGYGIDDPAYSDYQRVDVTGRVVMIYHGEPVDKDSISYLTGSTDMSDWSHDLNLKLLAAAKHRARAILVVDPHLRDRIARDRVQILSPKLYFGTVPRVPIPNTVHISVDMAKSIIGDLTTSFRKNMEKLQQTGMNRPLRLATKMNVKQHLTRNAIFSKNVMGMISGSEETLKDQYVVLSAHFDHLGQRGDSYFPGANDNGSGTSALLEIMETLAEAKKEGKGPRRNVVCLLFTGEEKGLLGSKYYVQNPVIPLAETTVDINIDMIGRIDKHHTASDHYIYVIGSNRLSSDLHHINEEVNSSFSHLELDYTYNAHDDPNRFYYRSDHYNFAKNGIPSIFFFNGVHEDYHMTSDTSEKILDRQFEIVVKHIFHLVWELAHRKDPVRVDVEDHSIYDR